MGTAVADFMDVRTIHEVDVVWWWVKDKLHDSDYHIQVNETMRKKAKELERKYNVTDDTRFCCQFEGYRLYGEDRIAVEAAGRELASCLARFKGVRPLGL